MCDGGGGGWAQGCGKEKAAARSPFLGFPVMGVMRASEVKSVACELTGPSVSLYSIRLHTTLLYLPTRPLLTPPLFKPVYQLPYLRRMYSKISKRDFPKVILQYPRIMCLLIAGTRKSMCLNDKKTLFSKS